jgi:hypothetical protein
MKKILLFSALLCAFSSKLFAQTSTASSSDAGRLSIGIDAGLPVGNAHDAYSLAIGGDLKYSHPVSTNLSISLSGGYTELIGKDFNYSYTNGSTSIALGGRVNNLGVVPVKVGIRYGTNGFFGEAQFGAAFISQGGGTAFAYSPGIGYAFDGDFEMGVRYEGWERNGTTGQVALRLACSF